MSIVTVQLGENGFPTSDPATLTTAVAVSIATPYVEVVLDLLNTSGELRFFLMSWDTEAEAWFPLHEITAPMRSDPSVRGRSQFLLTLPSSRYLCLWAPGAKTEQIDIAIIRGIAAPPNTVVSLELTQNLAFSDGANHTIAVDPSTTASQAGGNLSVGAGSAGSGAIGGILSVFSGAGGAGAAGGALQIVSGNGGAGAAPGAVSLDTGSGTGAAPLSLGTTNSTIVNLGRTGQTLNVDSSTTQVYGNLVFDKELDHTVSVAASTTTGAVGGALAISAATGAPATAGAVGTTGGGSTLRAGTGGAGHASQVSGAGGLLALYAGDAGANGGAGGNNGGDLILDAGLATGAGTGGLITIGAVGASDVRIGQTGKKIGLYGGTGVVQHASTGETAGFTAGAGTAVKDDSTFTGNVGTKAYRLSDIVKALKNIGVLAAS